MVVGFVVAHTTQSLEAQQDPSHLSNVLVPGPWLVDNGYQWDDKDEALEMAGLHADEHAERLDVPVERRKDLQGNEGWSFVTNNGTRVFYSVRTAA